MKQLIRKILREQEDEIITAPPFSFFAYDWNEVLEYADDRLFRINGDIDLSYSDVTTLGGLVEVDGWLNLFYCKNLQSLGELRSVGGWLDLRYTTIAKKMTDDEIRSQVDIKGSLLI